MAKSSGPNIIEQHVEKAVLGLAALAVLFSLIHFVVSSPRRIEIQGQSLAPDQVDNAVVEDGKKLEEAVNQAKPPAAEAAKKAANAPSSLPDDGRGYAQFVPERLRLDVEHKENPKVTLAQVRDALPAPEKAAAQAEHVVRIVSGANTDPNQPSDRFQDKLVAHAVTVFEFDKALKSWRELLKNDNIRTLNYVAVEAERRYKLPDGGWSEPEKVVVTNPMLASVPPLPSIDESSDLQQLLIAIEGTYGRLDVQGIILEPEYGDILWPDHTSGPWVLNKPRTRVSDIADELFAHQGYQGRYSHTPGSGGAAMAIPAPMALPSPAAMPMPMAVPMPSPAPMAAPSPAVVGGGGGGGGGRGPGGRGPGPMPMAGPAIMGQPVPAPAPVRKPPVAAKPASEPAAAPVVADASEGPRVPTLAEQMADPRGILEAWVHDETVKEGMVYSYRLRLVLVSPLFGQFRDVPSGHKEDAREMKLATNWSEWSDPMPVKRATEFFFTGLNAQNQKMTVEVFARKWGARVNKRFTVQVGDPIGKEDVSYSLRNPLTNQMENTKVDFRTGAVAVDVDGGKKVRVPKNPKATQAAAELLYEDTDGTLKSRIDVFDGKSDRLIKLNKEISPGGATPSTPGS